MTGYLSLFRTGGVTRTFALATLGRFGYAVMTLVMLFTISQASGSFTKAATASASFGLCGLVSPVQARLVDRFTQRRVLPIIGAVFAAVMLVQAVAGAAGMTSLPGWVGLCLLAGLSAPIIGPAMRAQWRTFETDEARRKVAYTLDTITQEAVFLAGPVVGAVILATGPAWRGLILVAALMSAGVIGLSTSPAATAREVHAPTGQRDVLGPLRHPRFLALTAAMLLAGAGGAAALTGAAAQTSTLGHPEWAGLIEAATGVGAIVGGLVWGRARLRGSWTSHFTALLLARAVVMLVAVLIVGVAGTTTAMVLSGVLMTPMFVIAYTASDALTPAHQHTEASTWVTSGFNVGYSVGTAAAGLVAAFVVCPFVAAVVFLGLAAVSACLIPRLPGRAESAPDRLLVEVAS